MKFKDEEDIYKDSLEMEKILIKSNLERIKKEIIEECEKINEKMREEKDLVVWERMKNEFNMKIIGIDYK